MILMVFITGSRSICSSIRIEVIYDDLSQNSIKGGDYYYCARHKYCN